MRWILVAIIVACTASGDLLNTFGMKRHGEVRDFRPTGVVRLLASLSHNRYVIGGVVMMALSFFALLSLLSIAAVSFAVPASAASYPIETMLSKYVLKEEIGRQRWIGCALVTIGVVLLNF